MKDKKTTDGQGTPGGVPAIVFTPMAMEETGDMTKVMRCFAGAPRIELPLRVRHCLPDPLSLPQGPHRPLRKFSRRTMTPVRKSEVPISAVRACAGI